jgi:hypothetical protein
MNEDDGIKEIDDATWIKDEYETLNLYVSDSNGRSIHCWMTLRPVYCDRGHIQLLISGPLNLDGADSFPRFFFSFKEADEHVRLFLKWRVWKYRVHQHQLEKD